MKSLLAFPFLLVCLGGCATAGDSSDVSEEPLTWPVGQYVLDGSVVHRQDHAGGERTVRDQITADLDIRADGSMRLSRGGGLCKDPLPRVMLEDRRKRQRTFPCGNGTFVLKPSAETIRAEIQLTVYEGIRELRRTEYSVEPGRRTCNKYEYFVVSRGTEKNLRLRVVRK
jgi:hypothetical protein